MLSKTPAKFYTCEIRLIRRTEHRLCHQRDIRVAHIVWKIRAEKLQISEVLQTRTAGCDGKCRSCAGGKKGVRVVNIEGSLIYVAKLLLKAPNSIFPLDLFVKSKTYLTL